MSEVREISKEEVIGSVTAAFFYEALLPAIARKDYKFTIEDRPDERDRVWITDVAVGDHHMNEEELKDLAVGVKRATLITPFLLRYYKISPHLDEGIWKQSPFHDEPAAISALETYIKLERGVYRIYQEVVLHSRPSLNVTDGAEPGTIWISPGEPRSWTVARESATGLYPFRTIGYGLNEDFVDVGQISADHADLDSAVAAHEDYMTAGAAIAGVYVCTRQEIRNLD